MSNANGKKSPFSIPDVALASKRTGPTEGTKEWYESVAKRHGQTTEVALEARRLRLSVLATQLEQNTKQFQQHKKLALHQNDLQQQAIIDRLRVLEKEIKDFDKANEDKATADLNRQYIDTAARLKKEFSDLSARLADLQIERNNQEMQALLMLSQMMFNSALIEGQCLIVDSLTIREAVEHKSGKKGDVRFSAAMILDAISGDVYRNYSRTKKLFKLFECQFPQAAEMLEKKLEDARNSGVKDEDDEDESAEEDFDYSEDEVVTESEKERIKRAVAVEAK